MNIKELKRALALEAQRLDAKIYPGHLYNAETMHAAEASGEYARLCRIDNLLSDLMHYERRRAVRAFIRSEGLSKTTRAAFVRMLTTAGSAWDCTVNGDPAGTRRSFFDHGTFVSGYNVDARADTQLRLEAGDLYFTNDHACGVLSPSRESFTMYTAL